MVLLWKVDFEVIVNSPACLSLDSQVMITSWWVFLIRVVLTVDLDLILSLYHWTAAAQMLSQSSTIGSSWRCSGEQGNWGFLSWSSLFKPYWPSRLDQGCSSGFFPVQGHVGSDKQNLSVALICKRHSKLSCLQPKPFILKLIIFI